MKTLTLYLLYYLGSNQFTGAYNHGTIVVIQKSASSHLLLLNFQSGFSSVSLSVSASVTTEEGECFS